MSEAIQAGAAVPHTDADALAVGDALVWDLVRGLWRFAAVGTMIELGCAEHLGDGPLTTAELAKRCGAHADSLERVLRAVATVGLVETVAPGTYALTGAGAVLRTKAPPIFAARFNTAQPCWDALGALTQTVRTGQSAFAERYGSIYDYLGTNPEFARLFNEFMVARSRPVSAKVAQIHDFSTAQVVVDVGGGNGTFLASILGAHSHLRGMLLEREHALPGARDLLAAEGVADRCELISGDFFTSVPAGGDVYLLASIVHNWDDEDALRILRNVREAMNEGGRVLLVDLVLPDGDQPHMGKDLDVRMLTLFGPGKERNRGEYFSLLGRAGLSPGRVADLVLGLSLIEASPV
ncbi:MAG: methyltransferase [Micromonosporaceae bacterium]